MTLQNKKSAAVIAALLDIKWEFIVLFMLRADK